MKIEQLMVKSKSTPELIIFGENHFKFDEVSRIRQKVIEFKPDIIVHELFWEDESYYKNHLPDVLVVPLEKEVGESNSLKAQFTSREKSMMSHLTRYYRNYNRIAVVIGDTHLRTIDTKELGKRSPIVQWVRNIGAKIIRRKYQEIV